MWLNAIQQCKRSKPLVEGSLKKVFAIPMFCNIDPLLANFHGGDNISKNNLDQPEKSLFFQEKCRYSKFKLHA
jgi:hypothetical protein